MKLLLPLLVFLLIFSPVVHGQQLALKTPATEKVLQTPDPSQTMLQHWHQNVPAPQHADTTMQVSTGSSSGYLLLKASFNYSAARTSDRKVPLARLEAEVPVYREVVHLGLIFMPALVQYAPDDNELKLFGGLSGGIHFPFNKVIDPSGRFVWTGFKPFMRGYATVHTGPEEEDAEFDGHAGN